MTTLAMEKTITVTTKVSYEWWKEEGGPIERRHREALQETAEETIREGLKKGQVEGQLLDSIRMEDSDPDAGVPYQGWWKELK